MDGRAFLVSTEGGDIPFGLPHGFGLFHRDCRFLDGLELTVNGKAPTVLSGRGSLLGFRPDALQRRLHIRRPLLPEWLEWVEIENLWVGAARVDVRFERGAAADRGSAVKWAIREGELDVAHTDSAPPPGAFE